VVVIKRTAQHQAAKEVVALKKRRAANQRRYLKRLAKRVDLSILMSDEMWR
jgi:hypothetical protein